MRLEPTQDVGQGNFYAMNSELAADKHGTNIRWNSTEEFVTVTPLEEKHQLFVCAEKGELLLFVPSVEHTRKSFSKATNDLLIAQLLKSVKQKPNMAKSKGRVIKNVILAEGCGESGGR